MQVVYTCNFVSSTDRLINIAVRCIILVAGQLLFDVWGFGWVGVGTGHESISSPGSGLGWVGSVIWWVGLEWVDES